MTYFFMPLSFAALALALFPQAPAIAEYNQEGTKVEMLRNDNKDPRDRPERMDRLRHGAPDLATIVVTLPEDARLTFDGEATVSTGSSRLYITPPLERGRDFHYTLEAKVMRNGKTEASSRQITVRAGEETRVGLLLAEDRRVAASLIRGSCSVKLVRDMDRVLLGGMPKVMPKPVKTSENAEECFDSILENENETIRNYRRRVSQCEALGEYAIAEHIRDILV